MSSPLIMGSTQYAIPVVSGDPLLLLHDDVWHT